MGLSLHAFHHANCVALSVCVTTACKDFLHRPMVCVAYVATLKKTPKMGLSLHDNCVGLNGYVCHNCVGLKGVRYNCTCGLCGN